MTEDEAKTKWCPQTLATTWVDADHAYTKTAGTCCLDFACMAWRWSGEVIWSEMSKAWLAKDVPEDAKTNAAKGYCGLGGKP